MNHKKQRCLRNSLIQLASMIRCVSGCEPFQFKGYGCFCGLFGSGKPVDPIDNLDCVAPGYANCALTDYEQSKDNLWILSV
uniref:Phospholipase A2 n=1 Tax=Tetranychus urticae TaxID=32264 RepID=T1K5T2_TETUR